MIKRPNIVIFTTDQQRADTIGSYGNDVIQTPNLDRLVAEGLQFDRAYINNPVCSPSRASMMTGRFPRSHGVTANGIPLPSQEQTLAHLLGDAGYRTAALGKIHLGPTTSEDKESYVESKSMDEKGTAFFRNWNGPYYGFDYVQLSMGHGPGGNRGHYQLWLEENHPQALQHFEDPDKYALEAPSGAPFGSLKWGLPPQAHSSTWVAEATCEYVEAHKRTNREKPFFAWINFQDPHTPMACPAPYCYQYDPKEVPLPIEAPLNWENLPPHFEAKYKGQLGDFPLHTGPYGFPGRGDNQDLSSIPEEHTREIIAHYYGMVSLIDNQVGRVLTKLKELEMEDDTIVIFTSDHGELLGDHGLWLKGPFHYEGLLRVPMIWRYPRKIEPERKTGSLFSHVDLVPTLLEWAGVDPHEGIQGVSQTGVIEGRLERIRENALCEFRVHYGENAINAKTLVTNRYKITYYAGYKFGEMYDLRKDPQERINLWSMPDRHDKKKSLLTELMTLLVQTEDPMPLQVAEV